MAVHLRGIREFHPLAVEIRIRSSRAPGLASILVGNLPVELVLGWYPFCWSISMR